MNEKNIVSLDKKQEEILEILAKSEENKTESLFVDGEGELHTVDELTKLIFNEGIDDPETKHDLYYRWIQRLLRKGLEQSAANKKAKEIIREEMNTFLANGNRKVNGVRGLDSRMGYITNMEKVIEILIPWYSKKGTTVELFKSFQELNKQYYGV